MITSMTHPEKVRCLIIGSGPAGYTAAIYTARANLSPVLYTGMQPGGQLTTTTEVDNFPGYPDGVSANLMMDDFRKQAERFDAQIRFGHISKVDFDKYPYLVTVDEEHFIEAESVIIATGATAKYLGLPSEDRFKGYGVSACATCDGFFYRGKDVAVVGGGDTACEEATYLAGLCRKVYMIVRRNELRACKAMQKRVFETPNIEILWETQTKELVGDRTLTGALLFTKEGEKKLPIEGFFLAIGHHPNSEVFSKWVHTDKNGYIKTVPGTSITNVKGVFACGDVQDPEYRQAITAAGSGCKAAIDAERFLIDRCLNIQ
ncbi:MAG: thioredoxin-disulfide reductase [Bacteroidales bacterium]|jgi:thioredoxin reductase (NADPH)|nr:thioredoxin-disulfide reductase [Bacteroidales bacterium]